MMISRTGNNEEGFSFLEVMAALVILSTGIIAVYQALLVSLDYQRHTANRLYALHLLNDKVEEVLLQFEAEGGLSPKSPVSPARLNGLPVNFTPAVKVEGVTELKDIVKADVSLSWTEKDRRINQSRTVYLYHLLKEEGGQPETSFPGQ